MKFLCDCGKLIVDQTDDLPYKGHLISDQDYNDYFDAIDAAIEKGGPSQSDKEKEIECMIIRSINAFRSIYQCSNCGTIFINDSEGKFHLYAPKSIADSKTILQSKSKNQVLGS